MSASDLSKHSHATRSFETNSNLFSPEFRPEAAVRAGDGGGGEAGAGVGQGQRVWLVRDRGHRGEARHGRVAWHRAQAARVAGAWLLVAGVACGDRQLARAVTGTQPVIRGHGGQGPGVSGAGPVAAQGGVSVWAGAAHRGREHGGAPGGRQPRHGGGQRGVEGGGRGSVA